MLFLRCGTPPLRTRSSDIRLEAPELAGVPLRWALGQVPASVKPNIATVTPGFAVLPPQDPVPAPATASAAAAPAKAAAAPPAKAAATAPAASAPTAK